MRHLYVDILDTDSVPKPDLILNISLQDVSEEVGIKAMSTFMVFKDGEKLGELVGADPDELQVSSRASFSGMYVDIYHHSQTLVSDHCSA